MQHPAYSYQGASRIAAASSESGGGVWMSANEKARNPGNAGLAVPQRCCAALALLPRRVRELDNHFSQPGKALSRTNAAWYGGRAGSGARGQVSAVWGRWCLLPQMLPPRCPGLQRTPRTFPDVRHEKTRTVAGFSLRFRNLPDFLKPCVGARRGLEESPARVATQGFNDSPKIDLLTNLLTSWRFGGGIGDAWRAQGGRVRSRISPKRGADPRYPKGALFVRRERRERGAGSCTLRSLRWQTARFGRGGSAVRRGFRR